MVIYALFNWLWPEPLVLLAVLVYDAGVWGNFLEAWRLGDFDVNFSRRNKLLTTIFAPELIVLLLTFGWFT